MINLYYLKIKKKGHSIYYMVSNLKSKILIMKSTISISISSNIQRIMFYIYKLGTF